MNRYVRVLVAIGLTLVAFQIFQAFMDHPVSDLAAIVVGLCTWALTGIRARRED